MSRHVLPIVLVSAAVPMTGFAQAGPDAGALRQQIEQGRNAAIPEVSAPLASPTKPPAAQGGASVKVERFAIQGNTLLSESSLQALLRPYVGQSLDFAGLQAASDAVAEAYRQAGWLARVFLPPQDVSAGTITLKIIEARFAGLRLEGDAPTRVMRAEIDAYFDAVQARDAALSTQALDRALMLVDDLPGVALAGTLAPGQTSGETALVLRTTDESAFFGNLTLDNTGARATGSARVAFSGGFNSPGRRGELGTLSLLHTEGSDYAAIGLRVPIGHRGLRAGVSLSDMRYRAVEGVGASLPVPVHGYSGSFVADFSYPVVRSRAKNVYLTASVSDKSFRNADQVLRSDYTSQVLTWGLNANSFDGLGGGGANSGSLQWTVGQLSEVNAHADIDVIPRRFHKISYSLSRQQNIAKGHSLWLSWDGQVANQTLDSSEKFYLGGAQSVRAYPASELSGDRGQLLSVEWRWRVASQWSLSAFVDLGRVETLPMFAGDSPSRQSLRGRGLSASWLGSGGMVSKLTWSRRNGNNPQPTSAGTDSDGTLKPDRWWFSSGWSF